MTETNGNGNQNSGIDENACERYLFGEMNEFEQEEFESLYFADDIFFERFVAVKEDLLDLYSRGELPLNKRIRLESQFLRTKPRSEKIHETEEFIQNVTELSGRYSKSSAIPFGNPLSLKEPETTSFLGSLYRSVRMPRFAVAVALLAVMSGSVWVVSRSKTNGELQEVSRIIVEEPEPSNREISTSAPIPDIGETETASSAGPETEDSGGVIIPKSRSLRGRTSNGAPSLTGFNPSSKDRAQPIGSAPTSGRVAGDERSTAIELIGTVAGPKGEPVASATVSARNLDTGLLRTVTAAHDGSYKFSSLPPGEYEISSEAPDLMRRVVSPVHIKSGSSERVPIAMRPGSEQAVVNEPNTTPNPMVDDRSRTGFELTLSTVGRDDGRTAFVTLDPSATRSGGEATKSSDERTIKLKPETREIVITLVYRGVSYRRYEAKLTSIDGTEVWRRKNISPISLTRITFQVPRSALKNKDYFVVLAGTSKSGKSQVIHEYYLQVEPSPSK